MQRNKRASSVRLPIVTLSMLRGRLCERVCMRMRLQKHVPAHVPKGQLRVAACGYCVCVPRGKRRGAKVRSRGQCAFNLRARLHATARARAWACANMYAHHVRARVRVSVGAMREACACVRAEAERVSVGGTLSDCIRGESARAYGHKSRAVDLQRRKVQCNQHAVSAAPEGVHARQHSRVGASASA
eukprot:5342235-Pleurochrysis_carterae.AAC.1